VICLAADFSAVGQFFDDFSEVTDDMVVTARSRAARGMTSAQTSAMEPFIPGT
jgi:predicted phosphoribosyltransferase